MPTKTEFYQLADGTEAVRCNSPQFFTGVQSDDNYWTGTSNANDPSEAWTVYLGSDSTGPNIKIIYDYVWPVRSYND